MTNNDILRRIRYAFDFSDQAMMDLFAAGGLEASRAEISDWLKKDDDPAFVPCSGETLARLLDGLICSRRGSRSGPPARYEGKPTNNAVLRKIKIALTLVDQDMLEIMELGGMPLSKTELSALFRKPEHRNYRQCQDQLMRNFLRGLALKLRGDRA